jgi:hypothetical protein
MGQVDAGGGLGGARDAHQHHVGLLQILAALAVVMADGVVQRVHPVEIVGVQGVLHPHPAGDRSAQVAGKRRDQRIQRRDAGHVELATAFLQGGAQLVVDDGVDHHPGRFLDVGQGALQLSLRANKGVDVLDGQDVLEPGADGARQGVQGLAGRIGDQMNVEVGGQAGRGAHREDISGDI